MYSRQGHVLEEGALKAGSSSRKGGSQATSGAERSGVPVAFARRTCTGGGLLTSSPDDIANRQSHISR